jgi:hypothetical protein
MSRSAQHATQELTRQERQYGENDSRNACEAPNSNRGGNSFQIDNRKADESQQKGEVGPKIAPSERECSESGVTRRKPLPDTSVSIDDEEEDESAAEPDNTGNPGKTEVALIEDDCERNPFRGQKSGQREQTLRQKACMQMRRASMGFNFSSRGGINLQARLLRLIFAAASDNQHGAAYRGQRAQTESRVDLGNGRTRKGSDGHSAHN